jgi:hypothetical protein
MAGDPGAIPDDKIYLRRLLWEAAVLEHQFMCQYLYAAFSLKRAPDATCDAAQFEHVRRWASTLYMIARQEMEHLSIVNSLLTATGLDPCLVRFGFPTQSAWFTGAARSRKRRAGDPVPCDLPFVLSRFDLRTVSRFACMESPLLADVPPRDAPWALANCFVDQSGTCPCAPYDRVEEVPRFHLTGGTGLGAPPGTVEPGTVQELYEAIAKELQRLSDAHGGAWLFSGHLSGQSEVPSEYDIYLFPICDLSSALAGVRLVKEQGEGIEAAAGFTPHFLHFVDMARDYQLVLAADPAFTPSVPLPLDPRVGGYANPVARRATMLFDEGYYLLLQMLTAYYAHYDKKSFGDYPHLAAALEQTAFAPVMTMFVRSLAQVMATLPTGDGQTVAGPTFFLAVSQLRTLENPNLAIYTDINHYIQGVTALAVGVNELRTQVGSDAAAKLEFIAQTMSRTAGNLAYIFNNGIYPKFDPDVDNSCKDTDPCA